MSDDVIALLKAHNPEPAAVEAPPIESLLARLDAAPADAHVGSRAASRARRRPAVVAALATVALVVVATIIAVGIGGDRAGVVQEARAAVAAHGAIVYTVTRTTIQNPDGSFVPAQMQGPRQRSVGVIGPVERWSAESPMRWRSVMHVLPYRGSRGGTSTSSYADGVVHTRLSWEGRIRTYRVPRGLRSPATPPSATLLAGVDDPLQTVRTMLDEGEVRRAGETTRNGHRVLRLVADVSATSRPSAPFERTVYLIDAVSYAPVEVERRLLRRHGGHLRPAGPIVRIRFERYERMPMTSENEHLLGLTGK